MKMLQMYPSLPRKKNFHCSGLHSYILENGLHVRTYCHNVSTDTDVEIQGVVLEDFFFHEPVLEICIDVTIGCAWGKSENSNCVVLCTITALIKYGCLFHHDIHYLIAPFSSIFSTNSSECHTCGRSRWTFGRWCVPCANLSLCPYRSCSTQHARSHRPRKQAGFRTGARWCRASCC